MALRAKSKGNRRSWLLLFAVIGFGFGVAFVLAKILLPGSKPPVGHSEISGPLPLRTSTTMKVHIFFGSRDGRHLQTEERRIDAEDADSAIEAIIEALLEGPQDSKLASTIPAGARLLHLFITDDGTAFRADALKLPGLAPIGGAADLLRCPDELRQFGVEALGCFHKRGMGHVWIGAQSHIIEQGHNGRVSFGVDRLVHFAVSE